MSIGKLADIAEIAGVRGMKDFLTEQISQKEEELRVPLGADGMQKFCQDLAKLRAEIHNIDPLDADTRWVNSRWRNLDNAIKARAYLAGEGSVNVYHLAPYLIKEPTAVVFGENGSEAHLQDQVERGGTGGKGGDSRGKKCDYIIGRPKDVHLKSYKYDELSAGENSSRVHMDAPHARENLLHGCKVARAQYLRILRDVEKILGTALVHSVAETEDTASLMARHSYGASNLKGLETAMFSESELVYDPLPFENPMCITDVGMPPKTPRKGGVGTAHEFSSE
ncbi:hypothetical protein HK104_010340 [Borealophlyctis nickersoniae]|nr:hypothetical protein HK104_010340 [Borealophlyctis nickersoniae]